MSRRFKPHLWISRSQPDPFQATKQRASAGHCSQFSQFLLPLLYIGKTKMKLSVIGAGYVGLTTAACLAQIGHDVFCSESDPEKLAQLQNGKMPIDRKSVV